MQKQNVWTKNGFEYGYRPVTAKSRATQTPLRRLDPLYSQLSHLGLATPGFQALYGVDRRKAVNQLVRELAVVQKLYDGRPLEIGEGDESLRSGAMELNIHLIRSADFADYSKSQRINILYQLRRAVEILRKRHFAQGQSAVAGTGA